MEIAKIASAGAIKNPLTIIAIFAGIAEISGTLVLPHIAPDNQRLYIYFLMSFPSILVLIFFGTLNFNHRVLYAPSDFQYEENFMGLLKKASSMEVLQKAAESNIADTVQQINALSEENDVSEMSANVEAPPDAALTEAISQGDTKSAEPAKPVDPKPEDQEGKSSNFNFNNTVVLSNKIHRDMLRAYSSREVEQCAISEIAKNFFDVSPVFDMRLDGHPYIFDAVASSATSFTLFEAFVVNTPTEAIEKTQKFLSQVYRLSPKLSEEQKRLLGAVVVPIFSPMMNAVAISECTRQLEEISLDSGLKSVVYTYSLSRILKTLRTQKST
ncbi:hypothetical protein HBH1_03263 [Herbaspirillum sp. BH-1]|uniref:hypothetical protein n=1 Tax=Herbaspirillum sp. (strain BH-1) TaxID=2058884 RepID=UPI000CBDB3D7|nr:hypothetical protein [Herbaspirillum sp. BH-1]PLY58472.1 hypothetical protein HBH1_03263 [Herbaspirillum sp. BH-1]